MTDFETLRALAGEGNEKAADKLADLADERSDLDTLNALLDEGNDRAGEHLTRRAAAAKDLLELQRISDAGYPEAEEVLNTLLSLGHDTPPVADVGRGRPSRPAWRPGA